MIRHIGLWLTLVFLAGPADAFQTPVGFNINFQTPSQTGNPSPSYSAASSQTGIWNEVVAPMTAHSGPPWSSAPLVDVNGNVTAIDIDFTGTGYGLSTMAPTTDLELLLGAGLEIYAYEAPSLLSIDGLAAGDYTVYTYGLNSWWSAGNEVHVQGVSQVTTNQGNLGLGLLEGFTHTVHTITLQPSDVLTIRVASKLYGLDAMLAGIQIVPREGDVAESYCDSTLNSTGQMATVVSAGSWSAQANDLRLGVRNLPPNQFGYFITSQDPGPSSMPAGSQGLLCISGNLGRHNRSGEVLFSGTQGTVLLDFDLTNIPQPQGPVPVVAGDYWHWQYWYRDDNPQSTSNFSDAVRVHFSQ